MRKNSLYLTLLVLLSLAALLIAPFIGLIPISAAKFLGGTLEPSELDILWKIRFPRVVASFAAGGALAAAGLVSQAMFRNILATPYTLGVSSGAAFGACLALKLGFLGGSLLEGPVLFALLGAGGTVSIVWGLASPARGFTTVSMLLAGIVVSLFFSSLVLLVQYLSDFSEVFQITRWLMGSLDTVSANSLKIALPLIAAGLLIIVFMSRELDLLTLGDDLAISRGLNAVRARLLLFLACAILVAAVVSMWGPIGFVGLIVPAVCREISRGVSHARLFWLVLFLGGAFLTICDTAARVVIAPAEMPVGVITSLLGGPFFLWLLLRKSGVPLGNP